MGGVSDNYQHLENNINNLGDELREPIKEMKISEDKKLFLVKNDYHQLPIQLLSHQRIRLPDELNENLIKKMDGSPNLRNLLCVDLQNYLLNILKDTHFYYNVLKENKNCDELNKMKSAISDIHHEEHRDLRKVKLFGFVSNQDNMNQTIQDELELNCYHSFSKYYQHSMEKYNSGKFNFETHLIKPTLELLKIINFDKYITDKKTYIYLDKEEIMHPNLQNFLSCLQYHTFFEDYVNSKFNSKNTTKNPIILINPEKKKCGNKIYGLEGYMELDGTLITKNNELILIECKNSWNLTEDHLIKFCGKASLVEKIYGIKTKKFIFSTGYRRPFCKNLEKFPDLEDIQIFDINDFRNGFKRLDKLIK
ncbi:MAG: hypothetical protein DRP06_03035 [Candidatus Aenigmatarchaeota archaeon]|nr:MAG: hypothetical protein DRP06_03035 [Candidatus Aenigmarchaeota archaeon]